MQFIKLTTSKCNIQSSKRPKISTVSNSIKTCTSHMHTYHTRNKSSSTSNHQLRPYRVRFLMSEYYFMTYFLAFFHCYFNVIINDYLNVYNCNRIASHPYKPSSARNHFFVITSKIEKILRTVMSINIGFMYLTHRISTFFFYYHLFVFYYYNVVIFIFFYFMRQSTLTQCTSQCRNLPN